MTEEDQEFERIEKEIKARRAQQDDDIQEYAREWVQLTGDEIDKLYRQIDWTASFAFENFARAVEAKSRDKNR